MLERQGGVCAICGRVERDKGLAVDHNHETDKVRELLCTRCNPAIGFLQEDPTIARRVADYLERHKLMSYLSILNLYKNTDALLLRECYALEKVHGTSAHVSWRNNSEPPLTFFSGGEKHERFVSLFDQTRLSEAFVKLGRDEITVFGEAYGGKMQGMSHTYGVQLCFIAFDVRLGEHCWLNVPDAAQVVADLGLEFVPYQKVSTDLATLDAERDKPSEVAIRRGVSKMAPDGTIENPRPREGIVLRPLIELRKNNGERIIAKHKGEAFQERAHQPKVVDASKAEVLRNAESIAEEWAVFVRLLHVLDKLPKPHGIEQTRDVITAMTEDIYREGKGEIVESREVAAAIGRKTARLYRAYLEQCLKESVNE